MTNLDTDIMFLPGIGPKRAELLGKELSIRTFRDMVYTFPHKYLDRSKIYSICDIDSSSAYVQLRGRIVKVSTLGDGKAKRLTATLKDDTGTIELTFFRGIKWVAESLSPYSEYIVFGRPTIFNGHWNMVHPEMDKIGADGGSSLPNAMTGIYPSTEKLRTHGITNKVFTKFQYTLLQKLAGKIPETLTEEVISANHR